MDLSLATFEQLVNELKARSNGLVVIAQLKSDERADGQGVVFELGGGPHNAIGLMVDSIEELRSMFAVAHHTRIARQDDSEEDED